MIKHFFIFTFICVLVGCQSAHLDIFPELDDKQLISQKLTPAQMSDDIDALINGAIERHPDLSEYADIDNLLNYATQLKSQVNKPLSRTEFFKVIGQLNHQFKDGHSFLIWPYQEYQLAKEKGNKPFPFDVALTNTQQLVLAKDYQYQTTTLAAGEVITAINGVPVPKLMETLQQYTGGETKRLRQHIVARRLPSMLWAVNGWQNTFTMQTEQQTVHIDNAQQWQSSVPNEKDFYWKKISDNTAYMYLAHFDVKPSTFEEFVDTSFAEIKSQSLTNLIIDVRNNPGGNTDTVTYLSRYLAHKPFRLVHSVHEKLNQDNRGWFNYKGNIGEVIQTNWSDWEEPISADTAFKGKTYLLTGPISYSAAIVFATTLQDNQFATLIGQATGGYANQTAQGNLFNLPHSQLRAYIATRLLVRPSGDLTRHHVTPDHLVRITSQAIQEGRDSAIEKALHLIRTNGNDQVTGKQK